ncbi:MAG: NlpC/P60 family protein [Lachnospiraceae bacterium]
MVASAREFLGTQYRWGSKSSQGIDCSGLAFVSYLDNGLLIYRDASIEAGYPVKKRFRWML